jgi:hypothetical protein
LALKRRAAAISSPESANNTASVCYFRNIRKLISPVSQAIASMSSHCNVGLIAFPAGLKAILKDVKTRQSKQDKRDHRVQIFRERMRALREGQD